MIVCCKGAEHSEVGMQTADSRKGESPIEASLIETEKGGCGGSRDDWWRCVGGPKQQLIEDVVCNHCTPMVCNLKKVVIDKIDSI